MNVKIYTDGACSGNPGIGGWAYAMIMDDVIQYTDSGFVPITTNNRMELLAVVEALNRCNYKKSGFKRIDIYSDSAYVVNCIKNGYLKRWSKNGWKNGDKVEVKHRDLWEQIVSHLDGCTKNKIKINLIKIKGHSGILENEVVDLIAKQRVKDCKANVKQRLSVDFLDIHI